MCPRSILPTPRIQKLLKHCRTSAPGYHCQFIHWSMLPPSGRAPHLSAAANYKPGKHPKTHKQGDSCPKESRSTSPLYQLLCFSVSAFIQIYFCFGAGDGSQGLKNMIYVFNPLCYIPSHLYIQDREGLMYLWVRALETPSQNIGGDRGIQSQGNLGLHR